MAKAKRKKTAPNVGGRRLPIKESKAVRAAQKANTERRRAKVKAILARTAAALAKHTSEMKGADLRDLAHLPVMTGGGFKPPGLARKARGWEDEGDFADVDAPPAYVPPPIAPPVPIDQRAIPPEPIDERTRERKRRAYTCKKCGGSGHRRDNPACPLWQGEKIKKPRKRRVEVALRVERTASIPRDEFDDEPSEIAA